MNIDKRFTALYAGTHLQHRCEAADAIAGFHMGVREHCRLEDPAICRDGEQDIIRPRTVGLRINVQF